MEAEESLCASGRQMNCTASLTEIPQIGHFTKCPKELMSYCIEGECRFMQSENKPSCVCKFGYVGSRCEFLDVFYRTGKRDQFIVVGLVLAILLLMIAIIVICFCVQLIGSAGSTKLTRRGVKKLKSSAPSHWMGKTHEVKVKTLQ
ncbi:probetacellulin-like isoform X2 [Chiloscyllium punctatum]|uniref:probetacellulin-like isoform X2 n=1 Tax=Chiloscyllium punctatum TaxID=137246 RepID=UPI003B63AE1E